MKSIGPIQQSHFTNKAAAAKQLEKPLEETTSPPQDSVSLGGRFSQFAGDTVRTVGGTAAVALKSTGLMTSSVLKGFGMDGKKADRLGSVASLATFGTTIPLTIMGTGVVGALAVKGLGFGEESGKSEAKTKLAGMKTSYVAGVNEAYSDGQFMADSVMEGVRHVTDRTQDKAVDFGQEAAKGVGNVVKQGVDLTKGVVDDVTGVAKDAGEFLSSFWS